MDLAACRPTAASWLSRARADNLVPDDTNNEGDVFVKDVKTGAILRASTADNGTEGNGGSWNASLSADGRYVAFLSQADNLVPNDTNAADDPWTGSDVFVKDLETGMIVRANTAADGTEANADSAFPTGPAISDDGRYVAFHSRADNLVPNDTNGDYEVFVKDLDTGSIVRADTASNGTASNAFVWAPSISADGRTVAFSSGADNLVQDDTNGLWDVFVKDLDLGKVVRASTAADGTQAQGSYGSMESTSSFSTNGRTVAFHSWADNLVPGDTNGEADVFVKDLDTGKIVRASTSADGTQGNDESRDPILSADGRYISFWSAADNLVPGDTNGARDIFVKNLATGEIVRASTSADGTEGNRSSWNEPSLSADGRSVAFSGGATNLVPDDTNGELDVFVKDLSDAFWRGETITGTLDGDTLSCTARDDTLIGLGGNDILFGLAGNDELYGDGEVEGGGGCVEVSFVSKSAGYQSTYGWYDTDTLEAGILVANLDTASNPDLENFVALLPRMPADLETLGFFLIPDGYNQNGDPGEPFADSDGTDLDLEVFAANGIWQVRDTDTGRVFEGLGAPAYFTEADKNPAGNDHVTEESDLLTDAAVTHNWEDLPGLGDQDFDDVVFQVETDYTVEVSFAGEDAGYQSTYGWYHTGTGEAEILVANVDTATNPSLADFTATLSLTADEIEHLGFFLIPDGYNQNGDPGEPLADGDGIDLDLGVFETNGVWQVRDTNSGYVFVGASAPAYFTEADKNPAGNDHVMEEGDLLVDGAVTHNWEDMPGLGDQDFNDAVFEVNLGCGTADPGTPGNDLLIGGAGDDTQTGGWGTDTFHFEGTDFGKDTITDFGLTDDTIMFAGVGDADDANDLTYAVCDFDADGAQDDIRITVAALGDDLLNEQIDVLEVGSDVEATLRPIWCLFRRWAGL